MTFRPFLGKKHGSKPTYRGCCFFVLSFQRPWFSFVVFLQRLGGFFVQTHLPPVGNRKAAQEMAELNLLDASRRSLLGTPIPLESFEKVAVW